MRPTIIGLKSNPGFALLIAEFQALSMSSDATIAHPLPPSPALDVTYDLVVDTIQPGPMVFNVKTRPKKQGNRAQRRAERRR